MLPMNVSRRPALFLRQFLRPKIFVDDAYPLDFFREIADLHEQFQVVFAQSHDVYPSMAIAGANIRQLSEFAQCFYSSIKVVTGGLCQT